MKKEKGLTLIELLIVILIVGVLAAVAIPTYTGYMQRARRADAKTALEQVRAAQEMWRAEKGGYSTDATGVQLRNTMGAPSTTISPFYNWSYSGVPSATAFAVQAVPQGSQASDPGGTLLLDQTGSKWSIDKNGVQHNYPADPACAWTR